MVYNMVHDLRKNNVEIQVFFVAHTYTKCLQKAHEISCIKISNFSSPVSKIKNETYIINLDEYQSIGIHSLDCFVRKY